MTAEAQPPLTPEEQALMAAIPWDRIALNSWGDGLPWPFDEVVNWLEHAVINIHGWVHANVYEPLRDWIINIYNSITGWFRTVFDTIASWARWLRDRITEVVGTIVTAVAELFNWLRARVVEIVSTVATWVWDAALWVRDQIAGGWNWLADHVTDWVRWLRDRVVEAVATVAGWLWDAAVWVWDKVWAGIQIVAGWLWDAAQWLWARVQDAGTWLWGLIQPAFAAITEQIDATQQWIQDHVIDPITDHLWAWWDQVKAWVIAMSTAAWTAFLRLFAEPFHTSFSLVDVFTGIWRGFVAVINAVTGGVAAFFGALWAVFVSPIRVELEFVFSNLEAILPKGPVGAQPDLAWTAYQSTGLQMLDRHMRAIGSLFIMKLQPGAWFMDTAFIEKMAYQSIGFDQLLQAAYIPAFDIAVGRNIRWRMNRDWRNELPSRGELEEMFAKHEISADTFNETMAMHGFDDSWLSIFRSALYRDPRMHEVMRLSEIFAPPTTPDSRALEFAARGGAPGISGPDWWYALKMAKAGYDDTDIPILVDAIKAMNRRREQTLYLMQLRRLHRAGYMTEPEVMDSLIGDQNPVPMRPDVAAARMQGMRLEHLYEETKIREDVIRDEFRKGTIDEDELDLGLSAIMPDDAQRALVVSEEGLRKLPAVKVAKPPDPKKALLALQREQQRLAIAQFRAYLIDADELRAHLQVIGLTPAFAAVITDLEVVKRDAKPRPVRLVYQTDTGRAQLQEAKLDFRAGSISDAELYDRLLGIEVPEDMAQALVGQELARILARPVKPPAPPFYRTETGRTRLRALQLQFRAEEIDDAGLFSGLSGLGIDPDYAQALVDVELARRAGLVQPEPTPEIPAYRTEEGRIRVLNLKLAFRKDLIDDRDLLQELLDLEMPRPTAEAIVEQELIRRFAPEAVP